MRRRSARPTIPRARNIVRIGLIVLLAFVGVAGVLRVAPYAGAERLDELTFSRVYLDRNGRELAVRSVDDDGLRRIYLCAADMPSSLSSIVLRAEDARFYKHFGVDALSMLRAAAQYVRRGEAVSGGSTITMQLSSLLHPRADSIGGKLAEIVDAMQLEVRLAKADILGLYVSLVPMGYNVEGFAAAARRFFDSDVSTLTDAQLAILAVIPRNPSRYDPWEQPEASRAAAARLLPPETRASLDAALDSVVDPRRANVWPFEAPHFVEHLSRHVDTARFGRSARGADPWSISTTLDLEMQHHLERLLLSTVETAHEFRISNGAGLFADPETGQILAYVGSADYYSHETSGQIDGVQILRQPGSTLKPFLYAQAFQMGFTPATVVPDLPLEFGGREVYRPENFNELYHGPVRIREALAASLNVPAVYVLDRISVSQFIETLVGLGFDSLLGRRADLGVSLALGGADVSLYELVQGYLSFYDDGSSPPLGGLIRAPADPIRHWDPATASMIRDIMSENADRVMAFGLQSPLRFDFPVAIKTGTSNQFTNIWAVGFSADIAGGVWMGNFSGETVIGIPGSGLPAGVLREVMVTYSSGRDLRKLSNLTRRKICAVSGMAAGEHCTTVIAEYLPTGAHAKPCDWHSAHGRVRYPQEYRLWAEQYGYHLSYQDESELRIITPLDGSRFYYDPTVPADAQQVRFFLTGSGVGDLVLDDEILYSGLLPTSVFWPLERGPHVFRLVDGEDIVLRHIEVR